MAGLCGSAGSFLWLGLARLVSAGLCPVLAGVWAAAGRDALVLREVSLQWPAWAEPHDGLRLPGAASSASPALERVPSLCVLFAVDPAATATHLAEPRVRAGRDPPRAASRPGTITAPAGNSLLQLLIKTLETTGKPGCCAALLCNKDDRETTRWKMEKGQSW